LLTDQGSDLVYQTKLLKVTPRERKRNLCSICQGHRNLCGKPVCPILTKAKTLVKLEKDLLKEKVFGSSPPSVFVGSWNYPKVLAGPLVPPLSESDTSIMDQPSLWLDKSFDEILSYRLSLVRGKRFTKVQSAANPSRLLSTFQETVMSSRPTETEMWFDKKPRLTVTFSSREPPSGPSALIKKVFLTENPKVPRVVDRIVADTDLKSYQGIVELYDSDIDQRQITRMFSIGLMGFKGNRRVVPTEWSITAVDDILGKQIREEIKNYPWVTNFMVFGHQALGNNVQILLFPSSWVFEAQEAWLTSPHAIPEVNYELFWGRKTYAQELAGAYYAARLPVLEYLRSVRRQAGAIVFMEVYPEWIPLGVWRFRVLCRHALRKAPVVSSNLNESLEILKSRLKLPIERWAVKSKVLNLLKSQTRITNYVM